MHACAGVRTGRLGSAPQQSKRIDTEQGIDDEMEAEERTETRDERSEQRPDGKGEERKEHFTAPLGRPPRACR